MNNGYSLKPVDTLFFRDARPMAASLSGHGSNWPLPTVIYRAVRTALLDAAGELPDTKTRVHHKTRACGTVPRAVGSDLFRSLRTVGPFPLRGSDLYLPLPADVVVEGNPCSSPASMAPLPSASGISNFPASWLRPVLPPIRPDKTKLPPWVSSAWFARYLASDLTVPPDPRLMYTEGRIGVALDDATKTASKGQLYSSEHLRLAEDVSLWFRAALSERDAANNPDGVTPDLLVGTALTLGGESRLARLEPGVGDPFSGIAPPRSARRVKWVLVSPACFENGWRPNWIAPDTGQVLLRSSVSSSVLPLPSSGSSAGDSSVFRFPSSVSSARQPGEDRRAWRDRVRALPPIAARLVGVCCPKPIAHSGWAILGDEKPGPKPTRLLVPAGAVFYFEAETDEAAAALVAALHGRTLSDRYGEAGMGLGFCGTWSPRTEDGTRKTEGSR